VTFVAVDWGTTNRRMFRIKDGVAVASERDDKGATAMSADKYAAEIATIRTRMGDLPILLAGMVGSTIGWRETGYVPTPAGIATLVRQLQWIDARTAIVPGVAMRDPASADVMRGEEVQLLGAVAAGSVPRDALLCQPGTHCKWVWMENGLITRFITAMTGELFGLLRGHGLLASQLSGAVSDGDAFAEGVRHGATRDLLSALFAIRASKLLGYRNDADAASYASGLLIGADVAARIGTARSAPVYVIAGPVLGDLYARAMSLLGGSAVLVDSDTAFVAGITSIWEQHA
jgi:2-dehydro-3-deoxygalactonokinase